MIAHEAVRCLYWGCGMMRARAALVAAMLVSIGGLVGCSAPLEPELVVESAPPTEVSEEVLLAWGQRVLEGQCMVEAGFRFVVSYTFSPIEEIDPMVQLYGRTDIEWVEEYGYGIHQSPEIPEPVDQNADYAETLSESEEVKFWNSYSGDPETNVAVDFVDIQGNPGSTSQGGCQRSAQGELYGDYEQWVVSSNIFGNQDGIANQAVQADPEFQQGMARWSDCMANEGFALADRSAALQSAAAGMPDEERSIALADANCLVDTGMFELAVQLHGREVAEFRTRYAAEWSVYEELRSDGLAQSLQLRDEYSND